MRESDRRDETALFRLDALLGRRLNTLVVMSCAQKPRGTNQNLPGRTRVPSAAQQASDHRSGTLSPSHGISPSRKASLTTLASLGTRSLTEARQAH